MRKRKLRILLLFGIFIGINEVSFAQKNISLKNDSIILKWGKSQEGFVLKQLLVTDKDSQSGIVNPYGKFSFIYSKDKPNTDTPLFDQVNQRAQVFPDSTETHIIKKWRTALNEVALNEAGEEIGFFPSKARKINNGTIEFFEETDKASIRSTWKLDSLYKKDILVEVKIVAKEEGYFSLVTPLLNKVSEKSLKWGMIPGYFQGEKIEEDLVLAYGYGQGIPNRPVVVGEKTASTLSPIVTDANDISIGMIPDPGYGRDPWENDKYSHNQWNLGLSLMNRDRDLSPILQYPVLGNKKSHLKKGDEQTFGFRYSLNRGDWYPIYKHAINDVYKFKDIPLMKDTDKALTDRVFSMLHYLKADSTSLWRIEEFKGKKIGAQEYKSSVSEADNDAMKNSDYGAMWMLAKMTEDSVLNNSRLPYARNFKLAQQQDEKGFLKGAAVGQYYLWKSKKFVEEWGNYVEPIGLTYYVMMDMGNILLFNPKDEELKERLRLGAERLLDWQHKDGHWEVGYDKNSEFPVYEDLNDLRPTFYGLLIAHRILKDDRYLKAAEKGADWFVENSVKEKKFLGVCGDFRFAPDFATGQSAQALLDLYDITGKVKYKEAAIEAAKLYTASIYTHPIPDYSLKKVNGEKRYDWQISQVGHNFEHGGLLGSANTNGPILLASHAGMFVRMFQETKDSLFLNMARVGAWGQDAFVDPETDVASYYWKNMNAGPGPYPHHAWWQIGWIMDYLMAETEIRSAGKITFPRGFITPKVGPHQTYGFAPGKVFDNEAELYMPDKLIDNQNPRIEYITAIDKDAKNLFVMILNNAATHQIGSVKINKNNVFKEDSFTPLDISLLNNKGSLKQRMDNKNLDFRVKLPPFGLKVLKIGYE